MEFDNATNLDRKSGVRGTKKTGEAHQRFQGFPYRFPDPTHLARKSG
jgi:hypothetical protein